MLLLEVLRVPRYDYLPGWSLSPRSSSASGLLGAHAFGVELPELEALELEVLELLVLEVLVLRVLELPELVELEELELKTLALVALELEVLQALELEALELELLEVLEPLVAEVLVLEVLELLELVVLQDLELETMELETPELEALAMVVLVLLSQPPLQPASPQPAPSPYTEQTRSLSKRREPVSCPFSSVCAVRTGRRVPLQRPPLVPCSHHMGVRPSSVPQCVPLLSPLASSLADGPDPESDLVRAASPTVPRLVATVVTNPSFESAAAYALVPELVDFAAAYRLDYAASLVAESESDFPPSVEGEYALGTDVLEDRQEEFECFAAAVPYLMSMLIAHEGDPDEPDISNPRSYAEAISGPYSS
ncbi:unnamed protein product [Closterium sp. Naga37s-1]|nr:unnamed protein product [Closterium sp. Naga37s-1]